MKITNLTSSTIGFTDIDRGIANGQATEICESWNSKADNHIPASGSIYVQDTDKVMLSAEVGQISKFGTAMLIETQYGIVGTNVETFAIDGSHNTFIFQLGGATQTVTLPTGSAVTMTAVVSAINSTVGPVSGFAAEQITFFRSSNMTELESTALVDVEDALGTGYGQRKPSILGNFLALACDVPILIGAGTANSVLGFHAGTVTTAK